MLLPASERVGGTLDYFQWTTILREVSAVTPITGSTARA
jgi:hypothetical protein